MNQQTFVQKADSFQKRMEMKLSQWFNKPGTKERIIATFTFLFVYFFTIFLFIYFKENWLWLFIDIGPNINLFVAMNFLFGFLLGRIYQIFYYKLNLKLKKDAVKTRTQRWDTVKEEWVEE